MPDGSISVAEPIEKDGTLPKTESSRAGSSASSRKELPEQRPAHPDLLGKELQGAVDRWKIGRKLGQGTFGTVRVATGLGSGIVAVCKTTPLDRSSRRSHLFAVREALALAYLPPHPSIPRLLDLIRSPNAVHAIISLAPGMELFEYVCKQPGGKLHEPEARRIVAGILEALRHVHENGVLHRDVKVDNVFWDPMSGKVTLLDFGLATFFDDTTVLDEPWGCVNYASPQLLKLAIYGLPYRANKGHAGLWAVGVLTQAILTGYFPFIAEHPPELLKEIESGRRRKPKGISDLAANFLDMMLEPGNAGKITPRSMLQHPWVAPFRPALPQKTELGYMPHLKSAAKDEDVERATEMTEQWAARIVPQYLEKVKKEMIVSKEKPKKNEGSPKHGFLETLRSKFKGLGV